MGSLLDSILWHERPQRPAYMAFDILCSAGRGVTEDGVFEAYDQDRTEQ